MVALTRHLPTKAAKIRALARANVPPADIARFLGIRYQHAYNVVKRSGLARDAVADASAADTAGPFRVVIDASGKIQIPERILRAWGVAAGDEVLVALDGPELRLFTPSAGVLLAQSIVRKYVSEGESLSDELIADRRRESDEDG